MTTTILETGNEPWGFYGTIRQHADPQQAWPRAFAAIAEATDQPAEAVRIFLDGRDGRHFADDVSNELSRGLVLEAAIARAVERWVGWTISRRTERETGIPWGQPYLFGVVTQAAIEADLL